MISLSLFLSLGVARLHGAVVEEAVAVPAEAGRAARRDADEDRAPVGALDLHLRGREREGLSFVADRARDRLDPVPTSQ